MIGRKLLSSCVDVDSGGVSVTVKFKLTKADYEAYWDEDEYTHEIFKKFSSGVPNSTTLPIEVEGNSLPHVFEIIHIGFEDDDSFSRSVFIISNGSKATPDGKKVEAKIVFNRQDGTQIGVTKQVVCIGRWEYYKRDYQWWGDYQQDYDETMNALKKELVDLKRTVDFTLTLKVIK